MNLIIGLGNPDKEHKNTRHNVGFMALDHLRDNFPDASNCSKFKAEIFEFHLNGKKNFLVYPQTYMNNSGQSVREIMDFYKLEPKDILVIHDDTDLPLGAVKFTESSGSAGHNGVNSLIEHLGTKDFKRIRVGVESREDKSLIPTEDFVLQNFSTEELEKIPFEEIKERVLETIK